MYRYFLALRYLLSRPINLLGMFGIALGVWALIVVVSIFSGYLNEIRNHLQSTTADLTATRLPSDASYAKYARHLGSDPNVADCAPRLLWYGLIHPAGTPSAPPVSSSNTLLGNNNTFVTVVGVDPIEDFKVTGFRSWMEKIVEVAYRVPDPEVPFAHFDDLPRIVISESRMTQTGLRAGDHLRLTTAQLIGDLRSQGLELANKTFVVAGAYSTEYSFFDDLTVFVHIEDLRAILNSRTHDQVSEVVLRVVDKSRDRETAARLTRKLDALADGPYTTGKVSTAERMNVLQLSSVDHQRGLMKLVLLVILVVAGFLMYATLSMMVTEKTYDIGILTAMGASPRGVMAVFLACGVAITIAGVLLGVLTGCLSAIYLDEFNTWLKQSFDMDLFPARVYHLKHVPYDLDPVWILQVSSYGILLGFVVAGLPAWRAARHDPLHSLREE